MLGKCPQCLVKLKSEQLQALKKGESARCFKCGKLYVLKPLWVYVKLALLFLPFIVPFLQIKLLTIVACIITFTVVALYHEIQAYLPLVEENSL